MTHRRSAVFRFEDRFFDDPRTVERLAALFQGVLPKSESVRIFDALHRDAVDAFIANLEGLPTTLSHFQTVTRYRDTYDTVTGWHSIMLDAQARWADGVAIYPIVRYGPSNGACGHGWNASAMTR
jgi:hypothetical protein